MASSSDNYLPSIVDPWCFRPSFQDPWITDAFSREAQTLSNAILHTTSNPDSFSSFLDSIASQSPPTPALSGISAAASDPDMPPPKPHRASIPPTRTKPSKRKSRASTRNHTTFITADPANFRHMVQQVTGFRFGNSPLLIPPVLKPEPHRPGLRFPLSPAAAGLPTLDTSAFLLNNQTSATGSEITGPGQLDFSPGLGLPNPDPIASDFDTFSSFPTLESWKAVL